MAKLTVKESAASINAPVVEKNDAYQENDDGSVYIKDAKGRSLLVRPLDILYESRLTRAIGSDAATNVAYLVGFVLPAASVVEIDGDQVKLPMTQREVDAAIQRLGREGINAVLEYFKSREESGNGGEEAVKN